MHTEGDEIMSKINDTTIVLTLMALFVVIEWITLR